MLSASFLLLTQATLVGTQPDVRKIAKLLKVENLAELKGSAPSHVRWTNRVEKPDAELTFKSLKAKIKFAEQLAATARLTIDGQFGYKSE